MNKSYRFGDLVEKYIDNRGKTPPLSESGIPLLEVKHLPTNGIYPILKNTKYVSQEVYKNWFRAHLEAGDILFSTVGTTGRVSITPNNIQLTIAQNVLGLRFKSNLFDPSFAFYYLRSKPFQHEIESRLITTVQASIKRSDMDRIPMHLPEIHIQKSIASVLGVLDDKIENNCKINETLEEIARSIFKSWFVDFDPVHAKAGGNSPAHMDPETAALFPSSFDDNGLPVGWVNSTIGAEVQIFGGATPSTKEPAYWENGKINWCTPKDLSPLVSPVLLGTNRKITETGLKKISSGLLPIGTLLMSSRAPVGYLAISEIPVAINQGFIAMKCNKRLSNLYVLFWCEQNMDKIKNNAGGSTFEEISKTNFKPISVICPSVEILKVYDLQLEPIFNRVVSNLRENQTLNKLRDILLPKLMSGQICVKDAEREVELAV
jgi:type I restriction enzyme, S subunit